MKMILAMAISANGIIATKDGSEDFLSHDNWIQFLQLVHKTGCFMWGRKTYDAVCKWEGDYFSELKDVKKIIIPRSPIQLLDGFTLANSPEEALTILEKEGFEEAVITGGSTINSEFAKRGLIDEVIFDVNPSILGNGIPVFAQQDFQLNLELISVERVGDELVELHYRVIK